MSNMRRPPGGNGDWIPASEAHDRGLVVSRVEDMLDGDQNPPLHRVAPRATEASLVVVADRPMPGILLEDGSIVVVSWAQAEALRAAFKEFRRVVSPAERDAFGPARACVELPA